MKPYLRVTLGYALFGVTWILVSDQVVAAVGRDSHSLSHFQTMKGALYVLASAALVYGLSRKAFEQQAAAQREREQFFHKTIEGSHHILMNYLNSMQLLTLEAENCPAMDPATLKTATAPPPRPRSRNVSLKSNTSPPRASMPWCIATSGINSPAGRKKLPESKDWSCPPQRIVSARSFRVSGVKFSPFAHRLQAGGFRLNSCLP